MKQVFNLNQGWLYSQKVPEDKSETLSQAMQINLPHSINSSEIIDSDGAAGSCIYQKLLPMPAELKPIKLFLEFEGVGCDCELWIEGKLVGKHSGSFTAFRFEITDFVSFGKMNLISIVVKNSCEACYSTILRDSTLNGGIFRDVNFIIVGVTHFALDDFGSSSLYINTRYADGKGKIAATVLVDNPVNYDIVSYTVYSADGEVIASAAAHPKQPDVLIELDKVKPWSGTRQPYLYTMKVKLLRDGVILDETESKFGFRQIAVSAEGKLYLNEELYRLKGIERIQESSSLGRALTAEQDYIDIKQIKELGANAVKMSDGLHSKSFLELCDSDGVAVFVDLPLTISNEMSDEAFDNIKTIVTETVKQCYNRPSVLILSLGILKKSADGSLPLDKAKRLYDLVKSQDKTRLITFRGDINSDFEICDLISCGIDADCIDDSAKYIEKLRAFTSDEQTKPVCACDFGASGLTKYHSDFPKMGDYSEEYQAEYHKAVLDEIEKHEGIIAIFASSLNEYSSFDDAPEGDMISHIGFTLYDRSAVKDALWLYKARWSNRRFVHIAGAAYRRRSDKKITLTVYSNCRTLNVSVNGKPSRAVLLSSDGGVFTFDEVKLIRGENIIEVTTDEGCRDELTVERVKLPDLSYIYKAE